MNRIRTLFTENEILNSFIVNYSGETFENNSINSKFLAESILGFKRMLEISADLLKEDLKISDSSEIEFYIKALKQGSFNFGGFLKKHVEPYPVSFFILLSLIAAGYILIKDIGLLGLNNANNIPIGTAPKIIEICKNEEYVKNMQKTIYGLGANDSFKIKTNNQNMCVVSGKDKSNFFLEAKEEIITENIITRGRITSVDVSARKNQIGFKINGLGVKIDSTLNPNIDINSAIDLLRDQSHFIEIVGVAKKNSISNKTKHITINKISRLESQSIIQQ